MLARKRGNPSSATTFPVFEEEPPLPKRDAHVNGGSGNNRRDQISLNLNPVHHYFLNPFTNAVRIFKCDVIDSAAEVAGDAEVFPILGNTGVDPQSIEVRLNS